MPAISFQERFAYLVEPGVKRQTIRPRRKRPIKSGDTLHLYTGMRTKRCRKLYPNHPKTTICLHVFPIKIFKDRIKITTKLKTYEFLGDLTTAIDCFARRDGFDSWEEMRDWFKKRYGLPFEGVLITW